MKILISAFEPFGGESINPAFEAVKRLPDVIAGVQVIKQEVPVVFNLSIQQVVARLDEIQPEFWLGVGQAGGRFDITVERVAINVSDGRIADNAGYQPVDEPIDPAGETAYFASIPIKTIVAEIRNQHIPASVSNSAGTYVCNHLMYGVLNHIHKNHLRMRGGFIHIPFLPDQAVTKPSTTPSMALELMIQALETAVQVMVSTTADLKQAEGATH
jgi:pyroglutamyl-peptidase